jgi:hypothetical protein
VPDSNLPQRRLPTRVISLTMMGSRVDGNIAMHGRLHDYGAARPRHLNASFNPSREPVASTDVVVLCGRRFLACKFRADSRTLRNREFSPRAVRIGGLSRSHIILQTCETSKPSFPYSKHGAFSDFGIETIQNLASCQQQVRQINSDFIGKDSAGRRADCPSGKCQVF